MKMISKKNWQNFFKKRIQERTEFQKIQKRGDRTVIAILIIGVAVYIGFTPLYEKIEGGVAGAVIGASFGALFVIVMTMYLLNKQTEIEQESKRGEKIFEEKMKIYSEIFKKTELMLEDGKIKKNDEMKKLPFVMVRLLTVGSDNVIKSFQEVSDAIYVVFDNEDEDEVQLDDEAVENIMTKLSSFANSCRVDLGVSDQKVEGKVRERTEEQIQATSKILKGKNPPVPEDVEITHEVSVSVSIGIFILRRYKTLHIRIFEGNKISPRSTKDILRVINKEWKLGHTEEEFKKKNTRAIGKEIIIELQKRDNRSGRANYIEGEGAEEEFFKVCRERNRSEDLINLTKKIHDDIKRKFSEQIASNEMKVRLVKGSDSGGDPKISVSTITNKGPKLVRCFTVEVTSKALRFLGFKSPNNEYRQLKIDDLFFKHVRDFSIQEQPFEIKGPDKYLPELRIDGITNPTEKELETILYFLKLSKEVVFDNQKLPYSKLRNDAKSGDIKALKLLQKYIDKEYIYEIPSSEVS